MQDEDQKTNACRDGRHESCPGKFQIPEGLALSIPWEICECKCHSSERTGEAPDLVAGQPTHTPGPWKVRAATFCDDGIPSYEVMMPGKPQVNALDARLITAAPDLYKAAIRVLAGLNARIDDAGYKCQSVPVFDGIADLHDAIALAREGRARMNATKPDTSTTGDNN